MVKTREEYLDGKITHRDYYAQFVTDKTIENVKNYIGVDVIKNSTDEHFNDIRLINWDMLPKVFNIDTFKIANEKLTMGTWVCIAKEAAKQIKEL